MLETFDDDSGADRLDALSVCCRTSACPIEGELGLLAKLLHSSQEQQLHVTYRTRASDGGPVVEAYVGRELAEPIDRR